VLCSVIFTIKPAFGQIDYSYGLNKKGLRFSLGLGGNTIQTTWSKTPLGYTVLGGLSYDFNHYFSLGIEGQYGSMTGIDGTNTFVYSQSVNTFSAENINLRFSIGLLSDFYSKNNFTDAIKRSYIGIGFGQINSSIVLTQSSNTGTPGTYSVVPLNSSGKRTTSIDVLPLSIGTNIAMPGVWGSDKVELNPNFQYSIFKDPGADGYQPTLKSTAGGYVVISVSLRYKF